MHQRNPSLPPTRQLSRTNQRWENLHHFPAPDAHPFNEIYFTTALYFFLVLDSVYICVPIQVHNCNLAQETFDFERYGPFKFWVLVSWNRLHFFKSHNFCNYFSLFDSIHYCASYIFLLLIGFINVKGFVKTDRVQPYNFGWVH